VSADHGFEARSDKRRAGHRGFRLEVWISAALLVNLLKVTTSMDLVVVLQCFQMADHFGSRRRILLDPLFNFGGQPMSRFQRCVFGKEQMEFHPIRAARIAMPQPMKLNPGFGSHFDEQPPDSSLSYRIDFIHQSADGLANQLAPHPKDVHGHENRNHRIKTQPAREHGQTQSREDAETGQAVGKYVSTIGLQNQRPMPFPHPDQIAAQSPIDETRGENQQSPALRLSSLGPAINLRIDS